MYTASIQNKLYPFPKYCSPSFSQLEEGCNYCEQEFKNKYTRKISTQVLTLLFSVYNHQHALITFLHSRDPVLRSILRCSNIRITYYVQVLHQLSCITPSTRLTKNLGLPWGYILTWKSPPSATNRVILLRKVWNTV